VYCAPTSCGRCDVGPSVVSAEAAAGASSGAVCASASRHPPQTHTAIDVRTQNRASGGLKTGAGIGLRNDLSNMNHHHGTARR